MALPWSSNPMNKSNGHSIIKSPGSKRCSYTEWKEDESLPGLGLCKKRAGLPEEVAHDAVKDAQDVILLLRKEYNPGY